MPHCKKYFSFLFFIYCFFTVSLSSAQNDGRSSVIKTIDGKKYYIHTVEKSQSLYSIAKTYNIDLSSLLAENPDAIDGLKAGDELKIPFKTEPIPTVTSPGDVDKYVFHKVQKKETVYGICKQYKISEDQLKAMNPELANGLKEGQLLKVGLKQQAVSVPSQTTTPAIQNNYKTDSAYVWHEVKDAETLYSVSKTYNTSVEAIQALNDGLSAGIKKGQKIRIKEKPLDNATQQLISQYETQIGNAVYIKDSTRIPTRPKKAKYNVGLFLPIATTQVDLAGLDYVLQNKKNFPNISTLTTDFYEGYQYALDSLKSADFDVNTIIFDVNENDSTRISSILSSNEFKSLDLVIGPWFAGSFKTVSLAARDLGIPCVSPTIQHNKILFQNPLASKFLPSKNYLLELLARFAADSLRNSNIMIVNNDKPKEQSVIRSFKTAYNEYLRTKYNVKDTLREVKGLNGVKAVHNDNKKNVVILLTENTAYLTEFFTQLGVFIGDKKEVTVLGNCSWMNIENLDPGYFNRYNFTCAAPYFISRENQWVNRLWKRYQDTFFSDPDELFFQSYDLAFFYLSMLKKEGPDFWMNLNTAAGKGCTTDFNFYSPDAETGAENRGGKILRVLDYKLTNIN